MRSSQLALLPARRGASSSGISSCARRPRLHPPIGKHVSARQHPSVEMVDRNLVSATTLTEGTTLCHQVGVGGVSSITAEGRGEVKVNL